MRIVGFEEISTIDFPGVPSAVIYTSGCSLRCPYCYNYEMVLTPEDYPEIDTNEAFKRLLELKTFIDGVVLTGGEPLIQKGLIVFIKALRNAGFKIKLDTNGMHPKEMKKLLPFVDFVAMDVKTNGTWFGEFGDVSGYIKMRESAEILKNSNVDYEFRITMVYPYVNPVVIKHLASDVLRNAKKVALQKPILNHVLNPDAPMTPPTKEEIEMYGDILIYEGMVKNVIVR